MMQIHKSRLSSIELKLQLAASATCLPFSASTRPHVSASVGPVSDFLDSGQVLNDHNPIDEPLSRVDLQSVVYLDFTDIY